MTASRLRRTSPADGRILLAPAMRVDLVIDMIGKPSACFQVVDNFYRGLEYRLVEFRVRRRDPARKATRASKRTSAQHVA
jgi:hypothetical protein